MKRILSVSTLYFKEPKMYYKINAYDSTSLHICEIWPLQMKSLRLPEKSSNHTYDSLWLVKFLAGALKEQRTALGLACHQDIILTHSSSFPPPWLQTPGGGLCLLLPSHSPTGARQTPGHPPWWWITVDLITEGWSDKAANYHNAIPVHSWKK